MCDAWFDLTEERGQNFTASIRTVVRSGQPWSEAALLTEIASSYPGLCDPDEACPHAPGPVPEWVHVTQRIMRLEMEEVRSRAHPPFIAPLVPVALVGPKL